MPSIEVDDREVTEALRRLQRRLTDLRPALQDIGETLVHTTRRRFATGTGPDGRPWKPLSPVTVARKGHDRPLIGETGHLRQIRYRLDGRDAVEVGSGAEYAAVQQFGARKGAGSSLRGRGTQRRTWGCAWIPWFIPMAEGNTFQLSTGLHLWTYGDGTPGNYADGRLSSTYGLNLLSTWRTRRPRQVQSLSDGRVYVCSSDLYGAGAANLSGEIQDLWDVAPVAPGRWAVADRGNNRISVLPESDYATVPYTVTTPDGYRLTERWLPPGFDPATHQRVVPIRDLDQVGPLLLALERAA